MTAVRVVASVRPMAMEPAVTTVAPAATGFASMRSARALLGVTPLRGSRRTALLCGRDGRDSERTKNGRRGEREGRDPTTDGGC